VVLFQEPSKVQRLVMSGIAGEIDGPQGVWHLLLIAPTRRK
jgi:hypothetical protein